MELDTAGIVGAALVDFRPREGWKSTTAGIRHELGEDQEPVAMNTFFSSV